MCTTPSAPAGSEPMAAVLGADLTVPLVQGGSVRYVNLDQAASTAPLQAVVDHLAEVTPFYSSIHRGAGYASLVSTTMYESARACVARFLTARPDDHVIFTRNTTDSMNLLARAVPGQGEVVVLDTEHHANLLPWLDRPHRVVPAGATLEETLDALERAFTERPAALLAVAGASNVTGELLPLERLVDLAHRHGARIAVDAAQLVPHRRVDITATGIDYLAFSGHKTYAPYGAGVLVGRSDWLDAAPPYLAGGGAVREVRTTGAEWAHGPERHEAGSPNVLGAVALARACDAISGLLGEATERHEALLSEKLTEGLARHERVRLHRIWPDSADSIGVVAFSVDGYDSGLVAAYLSAEHGIGVRDGRFCAHPLAARLGLPRTGALRASFGLGSRPEDAERLVRAVDALVTSGPSWTYEQVAGRWLPTDDRRPLPVWMSMGGRAGEVSAPASPCVAVPTGRDARR
ncbi:aminotransferase class V-fold PLP-dependent enzyme [Streptomyces sp. NPDC002537]